MQFTSYLQDGQLTIALTGEIDHHCARSYIDAISAKLEAYVPRECILDFQQVEFMDSSGIAVIINAMRSMTKLGGALMVFGLEGQPRRVFHAAGMDRLVQNKEEVL